MINKQFLLQAMFFCHQMPERSLHYRGKPFPICARCTGLAIGYVSSIILVWFTGIISMWLVGLLLLPMLVDGTGQYFHYWKSTNYRRLMTGTLGGIGVSFFFYALWYHGYLMGVKVAQFLS